MFLAQEIGQSQLSAEFFGSLLHTSNANAQRCRAAIQQSSGRLPFRRPAHGNPYCSILLSFKLIRTVCASEWRKTLVRASWTNAERLRFQLRR